MAYVICKPICKTLDEAEHRPFSPLRRDPRDAIVGPFSRGPAASAVPLLKLTSGMRIRACLAMLLLILVGIGAPVAIAGGQHSPRLADAPEIGPELVLADDLTSLAGVFQTKVGRESDARFGAGVADPDDSDADAFVRGGLRAFISPRSGGFPFDTAVEGELDVFFGEDNTVRLTGGPSFGLRAKRRELLVYYAQPLFLYTHEVGQSDVKLGVRLGADYSLAPTTDLRGDLVISSEMALRAALYFDVARLMRRR